MCTRKICPSSNRTWSESRTNPISQRNARQKKKPNNRHKQAPRERMPHHLVLPHSLDQIPQQTLHLEQVIRREQFTPRHPAQGNLKLEGTQHGVTIVTTMACSVSGLGTVDNGGTEMGPAVVGFSGADRLFLFPNAACREHQKWLGKLPYLMCCDDWVSGLSFYKRASIA